MAKIAEKMGISKQALNKSYYKDVNEIIHFLHIYVDQDIQDKFQTFVEHHQKDLILFIAKEILPMLFKNKEYLCILYGTVADPSWLGYLEDTYSNIVQSHFHGIYGFESEFLSKIIIRQVMSIIAPWLIQEKPEDALLFSKKFIFLMTHSTDDLLKLETTQR